MAATARLEDGGVDGACVLRVGGDWKLGGEVPSWEGVVGNHLPADVRVLPEVLGTWDTSLLLFLVRGMAWCAKAGHGLGAEALPGNLQSQLLQSAARKPAGTAPRPPSVSLPGRARALVHGWGKRWREGVSFVGECALGLLAAIRRPAGFRWMDCLVEMQHCWSSALPIVSLVSFLVGVILAFQSAIQLQAYGAAVFVADLVGLSVVREMGPMMAGVVMAGGIGAAFAAQLGNMRVDEEMDALQTLGISTVDFLVLPRVVAATLMMPVLALYADVLGILGGMFVSATMLHIPAVAYLVQTQDRVGVSDVVSGLVKSVVFGLAVGLAGCLRGMQCERSADGVGRATTSAVVTGILLVVVADAVFALIFNVLGV